MDEDNTMLDTHTHNAVMSIVLSAKWWDNKNLGRLCVCAPGNALFSCHSERTGVQSSWNAAHWNTQFQFMLADLAGVPRTDRQKCSASNCWTRLNGSDWKSAPFPIVSTLGFCWSALLLLLFGTILMIATFGNELYVSRCTRVSRMACEHRMSTPKEVGESIIVCVGERASVYQCPLHWT